MLTSKECINCKRFVVVGWSIYRSNDERCFIGTIIFYKKGVTRGINVKPFKLDVVSVKYNTATMPVMSTFSMDVVVAVGR